MRIEGMDKDMEKEELGRWTGEGETIKRKRKDKKKRDKTKI